uniref:SnoaL-like domain-containing protein n=1 Tax=Aureoumbra lagunensis TaxID=44058 RepID=A0A7S3K6K1_9STRA|mmetsp:Transcript_17890/g.21931  ORF Transcript_17890/g.21931 Transcript_17890/m.21931 type:complete len:326 (+) Transcript_17890:148-1125(+)
MHALSVLLPGYLWLLSKCVSANSNVVERTEKFWSRIVSEPQDDLKTAIGAYFADDATFCFVTCSSGLEAISATVAGLKALLKGVKVTVTESWVVEEDDYTYVGGTWVDAYECFAGPVGKIYQLVGHTYIQIDNKSGKTVQEIDMLDADAFAAFASECAGGIPSEAFVPRGSIDHDTLFKIAQLDIIRWKAILSHERSVDMSTMIAGYTTQNYKFCTLGYGGCHDSAATATLLNGFRASVSDMNLVMDRIWYGPAQVGYEWSAAYSCPKGGPPLSMAGIVHIFLTDDGKYEKYYDYFDSTKLQNQIADCAARKHNSSAYDANKSEL